MRLPEVPLARSIPTLTHPDPDIDVQAFRPSGLQDTARTLLSLNRRQKRLVYLLSGVTMCPYCAPAPSTPTWIPTPTIPMSSTQPAPSPARRPRRQKRVVYLLQAVVMRNTKHLN